MALQRWKPYGDMERLQNRVNRLFDSFFSGDTELDSDYSPQWYPNTNIYETKDHFVLKVDLPGMKRDDIQIEFNDGALTIRGERKPEEQVKENEYLRVETRYGKFVRSFALSKRVEEGKIEANLKDGVLELRIPKAEEAKSRSISIKTG